MPTRNRLIPKATNAAQRLAMALSVFLLCLTVACTPALNWRDVTLNALKVQLPCKPDRAERPVELQGLTIPLAMAGCQAADALFAVSHMQVPQGASTADLVREWQTATLQNMQVKNPVEALAAYNQPQNTATVIAKVVPLQLSGVNPKGGAIEAHLVWFVADRSVYHMAVYAPAVKLDMTEPFFTQALLQ